MKRGGVAEREAEMGKARTGERGGEEMGKERTVEKGVTIDQETLKRASNELFTGHRMDCSLDKKIKCSTGCPIIVQIRFVCKN